MFRPQSYTIFKIYCQNIVQIMEKIVQTGLFRRFFGISSHISLTLRRLRRLQKGSTFVTYK